MKEPKVRVETLIKASPHSLFEAFIEPAILEKFWLHTASQRLEAGKKATWEFLVPGAHDEIFVKRLETPRSLAVRWSDGSETEWTIDAWKDGYSKVTVEQGPFEGDDAWNTAMETVQGYTYVLCDLKVLLEKGESPAIVSDKARLITDQLSQTVSTP